MPALSLKKKDLPFLLGGKGDVSVDIGALKLNKPIPDGTESLLNVAFSAGGDDTITLGQSGTVKIGVSTAASLNLTPVFSSSTGTAAKLLKTYGIADFFKKGANDDKVVLCLEAAASGDVSAAGSFSYAPLKTSVELRAGADAGYAYLRALDKTEAVEEIVPDFFSTMRLPEQGARAPEPGEAIALQYGGYLRLGAELSAGYQLAGTKSVSIGQLALSEKYDLSIVGKIGLSAGVAGRFAILVTADDLPGWCRVQVRRHRAKDFKIAADVNVAFKNELDLPANAKDFLGAALGVNAKSFITIFAKAVELSDFEAFKKAIDGLAKKYVEAVIGKGFDALGSQAEFKKFMDVVHEVVTSYEEVEDRAVTLFDRYFDKLDQLTAFLDKIESLTDGSLDTLRKDLSPELWTILAQLTDGDPLGFLLEQVTVAGKPVDSLDELKKRAGAALSLVRDDAHSEIRRVIGLAKQQFGLDQLFREAAKIDTVDELQALANEKVGLFVTRLVGRALDSATNVKEAFNEVHAVLVKIDTFSEKLFKAFKDATNATYKMALHAEYSRASETDSLVDVILNMANPRGAGLLALAGKGDFEEILTITDTDVARLREGVFTHRTKRESAFKVNIIGWHLNYQYEGFDRVITETEQRLIPSDQGITVLTTASLEIERQRKRNDEETHVNFLLRALGESAGVVKSDPRDTGYVIDSLSSLTARYQLNFTDDDTSAIELRDYLAFAATLGLDAKGATLDEVAPLLPKNAAGDFGKITTSYDVRFVKPALDALLSVKKLDAAAEQSVRDGMRDMLLSNYLKGGDSLHDVAFAYATRGIFTLFMTQGFATFIGGTAELVFPVSITNTGISAPASVTLDRTERQILVTIYNIENEFVDALKNLIDLLARKKIDPVKFEKAVGKFGEAMKHFDDFDQTSNKHGIGTSTVFALFDSLVRLAAGGPSANVATLRLTSNVGDREVEKLYLSDAS
jgi:hypothetical protein